MSRLKLLFGLIFFVCFLATLGIYLKINNIQFDQKLSAYIAWHNPNQDNLNRFYDLSTSVEFLNSINSEVRGFDNNMELFDFLRSRQIEFYDLDAVLRDPRSVRVPIEFDEEEGIDLNLPENITYIVPGALGYDVFSYDLLLFSPNKDTLSSKFLNTTYEKIDPISKKTLTGKKDIDDSKEEVTEQFNELMIKLDDPETLVESGVEVNEENLEKLKNKEILQNVSINEIKFIEKSFTEDEYNEGSLVIGEINIHLENCFRDFSQETVFSVGKGSFEIADINSFVKNLCRKQFIKADAGYLIGTCEDCTYYPADKIHALRPDYAPSLAGIGFAPGNQLISTKAYTDFLNLYNAAKSDGAFINVTSGYRSYSTQAATFNAWVQTELALGRTQAEAEAIANSYSARPGFSEHQLGTALDLNGAGCGTFTDGGCSSNETVWNWLSQNAYKFGFVISYPQGKTAETGYTFEPWHYRWIGKELALEYVNAGGGSSITLNKFLLEHGDY